MTILRGLSQESIFKTWFSKLKYLSHTENIITIGTPNQFVKEWIEESGLLHDLASAIKDGYGRPLTPSLVITQRSDKDRNDSELFRRLDPLLPDNSQDPGSPPEAPNPRREPNLRTPSQPVQRNASQRHKRSNDSPDAEWSVPLKKDYIFSNYIVGPSNRLSHASALAVAQNPGQAYNPLFIHSAPGLGKTHLLQAICTQILADKIDSQILYLSCEDFVNQFIEGVKDGHLEGFRYKYRNVDMLLIDDIHFLADKPRIQEEFFHTFNTLYNAQKQIVLSADCNPGEIPTLNERLISRFKWGLVSRIDPPEYETRAAILKKKSSLRGYDLSDQVISLLAAKITLNIRELEGALNRLLGTAKLLNQTIDKSFVIEVLADLLGEDSVSVSIDDIVRAAIAHFGLKMTDLKGKKRTKKIALARQICMYLAREFTELTLQEIGAYFGGRDHTTILYGISKIQTNSAQDQSLSETIQILSRTAREHSIQTPRR
jgi:chromosomal replication initiator protein